jgi:hypothetical protein
MIDAVFNFLKDSKSEKKEEYGNYKLEVNFTNFDEETVKIFKNEFDDRFGRIIIEKKKKDEE